MSNNEPRLDRPYGVAPLGFRLPDDAHVGAVHLQVTDVPRSIDYYEKVLGLRVMSRTADTAALGASGADRPLVWLHTKAAVRPVRRPMPFGLYHFAVLLPDRPALGRFAAHLLKIGSRVGMADHLVSEALYLTDPDGLGIEVYADRPRNTWRHQGRQLTMATDPLDIRNLIAAGGEEPWTGAPAGTVIGHVHLHVGDLAAAEAFYHSALGFDKVVWNYPGALFLSAGGYHHHLGTNTWSPGPAAADDEARLLEWEVVVTDDEQAAAAAHSVEAAGYPVARSDGGWTMKDPWGTPLRVTSLH